MELSKVRELSDRIKKNISKVIVGKDDVIELVIVSLFCSGHVLLEDVPGVGKTVLAKSLAKSVDCDFKRIQFTPDLLPSDLTGINFYNQKNGEFEFRSGPVFSNIVLADEINRATPRTQSSLLEAMDERQVTIDGLTRKLGRPFFVIATQNPIESQGTFPLPEAQMDRFFMKLKIGYPTGSEGKQILDRFQADSPIDEIAKVVTASEIEEAQTSYFNVKLGDELKKYILDIVEYTRRSDKILLGVSPRASLALMRAAQVLAVFKGRTFVTPDDIKYLVVPVFAHRILVKGYSISGSVITSASVLNEILEKVAVPVENIK